VFRSHGCGGREPCDSKHGYFLSHGFIGSLRSDLCRFSGSRRVRVERRALARRERRAVRCGLRLGSLVRVRVAEEVLVHEPLGIQVLGLEVGELRAKSLPQVVLCAVGDLAQVAEGPAGTEEVSLFTVTS
jgi:hypothetical protein